MNLTLLLALAITASPLLAQVKTERAKFERDSGELKVIRGWEPPDAPKPFADRKLTLPPGAKLLAVDTFGVARKSDHTCDWEKLHWPTPKPDSVLVLGEVRNATCVATFWTITTLPLKPKAETTTVHAPPRRVPNDEPTHACGTPTQPGLTCSATAIFPAELANSPDTLSGRPRELRDLVNLVLAKAPAHAKVGGFISISDERVAVVRAYLTETSGIAYRLEKKNGRWVLLPGEYPFDDRK